MNNVLNKVINNSIENMFYGITSSGIDEDNAIKILIKSLDKLFTVDFYKINILSLTMKLKENIESNISFFIEESKIKNAEIIQTKFPEKLYHLNFNLMNYFDTADNMLCILVNIYNYDLKHISTLLKQPEEYLLDRYISIMTFVKNSYFNDIRFKIL